MERLTKRGIAVVMARVGGRSSKILQYVFHALRVLCDYCQQHTRRRIRAGSPLFPVSKRCRREPEFHGKLRLTQPHSMPTSETSKSGI
jgi:hypothetical protein